MMQIVGHAPGVPQVCKVFPLAFCRNPQGHWFLLARIVCRAPEGAQSEIRMAEHVEGPEDQEQVPGDVTGARRSRSARRQRRRMRIASAFRKLSHGVKKAVSSPQFRQLASMASQYAAQNSDDPRVQQAAQAFQALRQRDPQAASQFLQGQQAFQRAEESMGSQNLSQAIDFMRHARSAGIGTPESAVSHTRDIADRLARNEPRTRELVVKVCELARRGDPVAAGMCGSLSRMYRARYIDGKRGYHRRGMAPANRSHVGATWEWLKDTFGLRYGVSESGPFRDAYRAGLAAI